MRFTLTFDRPAGTPGRCAPVVIFGVTVVCHSPCLPNQVPGAAAAVHFFFAARSVSGFVTNNSVCPHPAQMRALREL